jgi:hypothetical protein
MTGLTSWVQCPDLEPFRGLKKIADEKKPAITGRFFIAAVLRAD